MTVHKSIMAAPPPSSNSRGPAAPIQPASSEHGDPLTTDGRATDLKSAFKEQFSVQLYKTNMGTPTYMYFKSGIPMNDMKVMTVHP